MEGRMTSQTEWVLYGRKNSSDSSDRAFDEEINLTRFETDGKVSYELAFVDGLTLDDLKTIHANLGTLIDQQ